MKRGITDAETCRLNGWTAGTVLEGDEGRGAERIVITAVGEEKIYARRLTNSSGDKVNDCEGPWTLNLREWKEFDVQKTRKSGIEATTKNVHKARGVISKMKSKAESQSLERIWKYELQLRDLQHVDMPAGAEILSAANQNAGLCIWAMVDSERPVQSREIEIIGTGNPISFHEPTGMGIHRNFIGTVLMGEFVWHVFERI